MARTKRKDEPAKGPLQKLADRAANEEANAPLVNPFAHQHGDYLVNGRWGTRTKVTINRGGTAIDRWRIAGELSDSQLAGILHCQNLWSKVGSQCLVSNFDKVRGQPHGDGFSQHEAFTELGRIAADFPPVYWDVFENVCRHDLPAGVAGSRLANVRRSAEVAAKTIVRFIADLIATRERLSY